MDRQTHFVSLKTMLERCPHCGRPVPLNGLVYSLQCPECEGDITIPPDLWSAPLGWCDKPYAYTGSSPRRPESGSQESDNFKLTYELSLVGHLGCVRCGSPLADPQQDLAAKSYTIPCSSCGHDNQLLHFAPSLGYHAITHALGAEGLGSGTSRAPDAVGAGEDTSAPTVLACPECSGSLRVTASSQRTINCEYCGVSVYLPQELWRRLHPLKRAQSWYLKVVVDRRVLASLLRKRTLLAGGLLTLSSAIAVGMGLAVSEPYAWLYGPSVIHLPTLVSLVWWVSTLIRYFRFVTRG